MIATSWRRGISAATLVLACLLACAPTLRAQTAVPPAAGDGLTLQTAYQFTEIGNLVWLQQQTAAAATTGRFYALMNDIDASGTANWNDAGSTTATLEGFRPIGTASAKFYGALEGNGHKILGLTINRPATDLVGLFGDIGQGGTVGDLRLAGGSITGRNSVGGLAGSCENASLNHCFATGPVSGAYNVGGLVGASNSTWIGNSFATGPVTGSQESVGGLVGSCYLGIIVKCYATGAVTGFSDYVGGLVGGGDLITLTDCYATGSVTDYTTGSVGGLVGRRGDGGSITGSYWDTQTTGQKTSDGGTGLTSAQMKQMASFAGWDFTSTWGIAENQSTPYLRYSAPPFRLDIASQGAGTVQVAPQGTAFSAGTVVTVTAIPAEGSIFAGWSGAVGDSAAAVTTVVMDNHKSLLARFGSAHEIRTLTELQAVATGDMTWNYTLMNDIDAGDTAAWNDAGTTTGTLEGFRPIGTNSSGYSGIFEGNGHKITGLTINRPSTNLVGLFGKLGPGGVVRNLGVEGGAISGSMHTGGLVGANSGGTVMNSYVTATVAGWTQVGGLVGGTTYVSLIQNCHATGSVSADGNSIGGLVGENFGVLSDSHATGSVLGSYQSLGGLAGYNGGSIAKCYATGSVASFGDEAGAPSGTGGLVGDNEGSIAQSFATGAATAASPVGGLLGANEGTVTDCYAMGAVVSVPSIRTGARYTGIAGGLIGFDGGALSSSYATGYVAGSSPTIGGLTGSGSATLTPCYWDTESTSQSSSASGTGKTTAQMRQQETFVGWDFAAVWTVDGIGNQGYPYLRALDGQNTAPGKPIGPLPANGATDQAVDLVLMWQGGGGASAYDLRFGTQNPPTTEVSTSQTATFYALANPLDTGTTYYWRVDAKNSTGITTGDVWAFTTAPPPPAPVLSVAPASRSVAAFAGGTTFAVGNAGTGTFDWTARVTMGGDWLTIMSGTSGDTTGTIVVSATANATSVARTAVLTVQATSVVANSPTSVTVTQAPAGPVTPLPATAPSPSDGAVGQPVGVTLAWRNGGGATGYDVYLDTQNPPLTRRSENQAETAYSPPAALDYGRIYFWRVDARNAAGPTTGTVWAFSTEPEPIAPALTVTPAHRDVAATAGATSFTVSKTGGDAMSWTAQVTSGAEWLTIDSGASGVDAGTVSVRTLANETTATRTGAVTVTAGSAAGPVTGSPAIVTVTQAGAVRPVYGHFAVRRVQSSHAERWRGREERIVSRDAYSFSAKVLMPATALASITSGTVLTIELGDQATSSGAHFLFERPLSDATTSTLAGRSPAAGGSVLFTEARPGSAIRALRVSLRWTRYGLLTVSVTGTPAAAAWDPANPAEDRAVQNVTDLSDSVQWPAGKVTGVPVPVFMNLQGVSAAADVVTCQGWKRVGTSPRGDLVSWNVRGR